jgi:nucleoside-diphosphate-sugar epimerase
LINQNIRILFTGHKGFLGRELLPHVDRNYQVFVYENDLCNFTELEKFANNKGITHVIHAATRGGRRLVADTTNVLLNNLMATLNVFRLQKKTLSFCSGKIYNYAFPISGPDEITFRNGAPEDYYGLSKYLIRNMSLQYPQVILMRFFNCFGLNENPNRFIKSNLERYIRREPMVIHNNLVMDFFYSLDLIPLISRWIDEIYLPKELNLVYEQKYQLSEICSLINQLNDYDVPIIIESAEYGKNYFGDGTNLQKLNIGLLGLKYGLNSVYTEMLNNFK